MNANYMNAGLVPGNNGHLEWLRKMGYDVGPMMQNFGLEQAGADIYGGQQQGIPGYSQESVPGYSQEMPGGTGWDGANQKMAWLAQNAINARRQKKATAAPSLPAGHPGSGPSYDVENKGGSNKGFFSGLGENIFGDGAFGQIAGMLMPGLSRPGLMAPLPFAAARKIFK